MKNHTSSLEALQIRGEGEKPLVFLHYFGGSSQSWESLIDILYTGYRCISIDLPGFGNTTIHVKPSIEYYAQFVQDVLEQHSIESYTLIGHSMSGKIALKMAIQDKKNSIQQLILLAPSPPTIEKMTDVEKKRMLNHPNKNVAEETVHKIIVKPLKQELFKTAVDTQLMIDESVWRWWINEGMNTPLSQDTKELNNIPVTVVNSEDDPCITTKMIKQEVLPNLPSYTKQISCKGIGHLYPMEDPKWMADTIKSIIIGR